ncbi:hypothetical protein GE21DRAFT_1202878 [Neurospora crassa]|nr:hypothetical protein GE21DRAFT_1202878 [Neurospora crassa]
MTSANRAGNVKASSAAPTRLRQDSRPRPSPPALVRECVETVLCLCACAMYGRLQTVVGKQQCMFAEGGIWRSDAVEIIPDCSCAVSSRGNAT